MLEVFLAFLRLGLTSFGGPVAHIGYFRSEFVGRRQWVEEAAFADFVALCQFLPGPASSQLGIIIGMSRAGIPGGLAAWLGFTAPSAIALAAFAYAVLAIGDLSHVAWLHGLKIVAAAVVAQAVWNMARNLCPDRERASVAVAAALVCLAAPSSLGQLAAIALGAAAGWFSPQGAAAVEAGAALTLPVNRAMGLISLALFAALLAGLPLLAEAFPNHALQLFSAFYHAGSLVFGGGHVVLPLLREAVAPPGWIGDDAFLAGYGAAQAVPGPLFAFAAFLGAAMKPAPSGWLGALLCLVAIYLPSFLLLFGALPFWSAWRRMAWARSILRGINAAVVGVLLAALYDPVWTAAIFSRADFSLAALAFLMLQFWRVPPWIVVVLGAFAASGIATI